MSIIHPSSHCGCEPQITNDTWYFSWTSTVSHNLNNCFIYLTMIDRLYIKVNIKYVYKTLCDITHLFVKNHFEPSPSWLFLMLNSVKYGQDRGATVLIPSFWHLVTLNCSRWHWDKLLTCPGCAVFIGCTECIIFRPPHDLQIRKNVFLFKIWNSRKS